MTGSALLLRGQRHRNCGSTWQLGQRRCIQLNVLQLRQEYEQHEQIQLTTFVMSRSMGTISAVIFLTIRLLAGLCTTSNNLQTCCDTSDERSFSTFYCIKYGSSCSPGLLYQSCQESLHQPALCVQAQGDQGAFQATRRHRLLSQPCKASLFQSSICAPTQGDPGAGY